MNLIILILSILLEIKLIVDGTILEGIEVSNMEVISHPTYSVIRYIQF